MRKILLLFFTILMISFSSNTMNGQLITQTDPLILIVDSNIDDIDSRDLVPGDGICESVSGSCTFRAAIDEANASTGDVRIVLPGRLPVSGDNTYRIARAPSSDSESLYDDTNEYGDLDLNGTFTSLHIQGTGTPGPTIETNFSANDRALDIGEGKSVLIERIYFRQVSSERGSQGNQDGSGPEGVNGTDGGNGGAIRVGPNATFQGDQLAFVQCTTGGGGQGVTPSSSAGTTKGGDGGDGGDGGAIYLSTGTNSLITRATFQGCITGGGGGAGDAGGPDGGNADGGNGGNGGNGGAIYSAGNLTLRSCTLVGNEGGGGGAAGAAKGSGTTGFQGSPAQGGGVAIGQRVPGTTNVVNEGTLIIQNNVIAKNEPSGPAQDLFQAPDGDGITSEGYNMIGITAGLGMFVEQATDTLGGESNSLDPQAGGIQSDGTYAVPILEFGANSIAINNGTTIATFDYDSRGYKRGASGNVPDIGAWEYQAEPIEDTLRISEVDVNTSDGSGEFIEVINEGNYNLQMDGYVAVGFGPDGNSCLVRGMYGEVAPGEYFVLGDTSNVPNLEQPFTYGGQSSTCGADETDHFDNTEGAIAIYSGIPDSYLSTFPAGKNEATRVDQVSYDNNVNARSQKFDFCAAFNSGTDCDGSDSGDGESIVIAGDGTTSSQSPSPGTSGASLPVEWLSFTAFSPTESTVILNWATAVEINNDLFVVERKDGGTWISEARIFGNGNDANGAEYEATLRDVPAGLQLFRLRQQDYDGSISYSKSVAVQVNRAGTAYVFPNPVKEILNIDYDTQDLHEDFEILVRNTSGVLVVKNKIQKRDERFNIDVAQLRPGMYYLTILNGNSIQTISFNKM